MSAIRLANPSMPRTMFLNLQQYMCIFVIFKYRSNIGGMSHGVCPKDDFNTTEIIFVLVSIEIQALTLVNHQLDQDIVKERILLPTIPNHSPPDIK